VSGLLNVDHRCSLSDKFIDMEVLVLMCLDQIAILFSFRSRLKASGHRFSVRCFIHHSRLSLGFGKIGR
jgi:hypothetical protein